MMSLVTKELGHKRRLKGVIKHVGCDGVQNGLIAGFENSDIGAHDVIRFFAAARNLAAAAWLSGDSLVACHVG